MQVTANWELPVYQVIGPVVRVHWDYFSAFDEETEQTVWTCQEAVVPDGADPETFKATVDASGGDGEALETGRTTWLDELPMIGTVQTFNGVEYRSLIDHNVWAQPTYPQGWELVDAPTGVQGWAQPTGSHDAYATGDRVTHPNAQDNDTVWLFESAIDANTTEPGTDGTFHRYWTPIEVAG